MGNEKQSDGFKDLLSNFQELFKSAKELKKESEKFIEDSATQEVAVKGEDYFEGIEASGPLKYGKPTYMIYQMDIGDTVYTFQYSIS